MAASLRAVCAVLLLLLPAACTALSLMSTWGAGIAAVNGVWERLMTKYNGAPQFRLLAQDCQYELFLHINTDNEQQMWWNIQEVNTSSSGQQYFGRVLYGRPVNSSIPEERTNPPAFGWQDHGDYPGWHGYGAPVLAEYGACSSIADCNDDDCLRFYFYAGQRDTLDKGCDILDAAGECVCALVEPFRALTAEELARHRADFAADGVVSIPNVLLPAIVKRFAEDVKRYKYSAFWQASFWNDETDNAMLIPRTAENEETIESQLKHEWALRSQKKYAYSFTRTSTRVTRMIAKMHSMMYEHTVDLLQSTQMKRMLKDITDRDYELAVYFYSRYTSGDFLDKHSDSVATRKIAYTLHFTEDWELTFGGLLMLLEEGDWSTIRKVVVPTFNTLTFFDVSRERFVIPHYVTEIVQGVNRPRIALTGWYQYKGGEEPFKEEVYDY